MKRQKEGGPALPREQLELLAALAEKAIEMAGTLDREDLQESFDTGRIAALTNRLNAAVPDGTRRGELIAAATIASLGSHMRPQHEVLTEAVNHVAISFIFILGVIKSCMLREMVEEERQHRRPH